LSRIQQLEEELRKMKSISLCPRNAFLERLELDKDEISEDLGSVGGVSSNISSNLTWMTTFYSYFTYIRPSNLFIFESKHIIMNKLSIRKK
jgi:hypothetical protein